MSYSFGLTLYTLRGGRTAQPAADWPARPRGRLVWLHAPDEGMVGPMLALARRLVEEDGLPILLTTPDMAVTPPPGVLITRPPDDAMPEVQAFLNHWQPEVIILSGGELRPALQHEAVLRGLPVLMVNAAAPHLPPGRQGWYPGLTRAALSGLRHLLVLDEPAARSLRKAGAAADRIEVTGRMEEDSAVLPCVEADRAALARTLASRPIWLAACVPEAEEATVIAAHREALRLSHRLVLILVPQDPAREPVLAAQLEQDEGWSVARRRTGGEPDAETAVYLPEDASEFGLWYRLAPVTYLGGSLLGTGCARNPLEPAALGSAILHGPRVGAHSGMFDRLGAARAARRVGSGADLVQALGDLLSPDRAARQAQAAWAVASEGADVSLRIVALIRQILEGE